MILKTFLFATIMVVESALSSTIYIPPSSFQMPSSLSSPKTLAPPQLALQTLRTLRTLSFIISQFGGVTTTSASVANFPELRRVFYLGLDVLSSDKGVGREFVRTLCSTKESRFKCRTFHEGLPLIMHGRSSSGFCCASEDILRFGLYRATRVFIRR